jgi:hypothetical protein
MKIYGNRVIIHEGKYNYPFKFFSIDLIVFEFIVSGMGSSPFQRKWRGFFSIVSKVSINSVWFSKVIIGRLIEIVG